MLAGIFHGHWVALDGGKEGLPAFHLYYKLVFLLSDCIHNDVAKADQTWFT
jgi:hypothetical protein